VTERRDWAAVFGSGEFQREAEAWTRAALAARGWTRLGRWHRRRVRPWSTHATLPAVDPDGHRTTLWFKAGNPGQAFEPRLLQVLDRLVPGAVPAPVVVAAERGWMLTRDFGPTLADRGADDDASAATLVACAARLQHALAGHRALVLGTGVDEVTPALLAAAVEALVADAVALPADHPGHLPAGEVAAVREGVAAAGQLLSELAAGPVPASLDHNDLHTANAYPGPPGGPPVGLFDLGDALWGHPFVGLAWLGPAAMRDALPLFDRWGSAEQLAPLAAIAVRLQPVHRLLAWWRVLAPVLPEAWPEHAASVPHWCRQVAGLVSGPAAGTPAAAPAG